MSDIHHQPEPERQTDLADVAGPAVRLVEPSPVYSESYRSLVREFVESGSPVVPFTLRFPHDDDFDGLTRQLHDASRGVGIPEGFVANTTYWLVDETGEVLGVSNLRHALTDKLRREGGHVGYGVRPSRRGQGLATAMLALTLEKARALGIDRVLITCGKENVSSAKVIRKNGGRLLIAQARHEGFQLVSRDPHIPRYGVPHVVA